MMDLLSMDMGICDFIVNFQKNNAHDPPGPQNYIRPKSNVGDSGGQFRLLLVLLMEGAMAPMCHKRG